MSILATPTPEPPAPTQNTGNITLAFTVDGSGNVTLDASCADPDPAAYVDEFDGAVGTVTDPAHVGAELLDRAVVHAAAAT